MPSTCVLAHERHLVSTGLHHGVQYQFGQSYAQNDIMDKAFDVRPESRLACQAKLGDDDIVVEITDESLKSWLDENPEARKKQRSAS